MACGYRSADCSSVAFCTPAVASVEEHARVPPIVPVQCTNSRFRSFLVAKFATYQLELQSARSLLLLAGMAELE